MRVGYSGTPAGPAGRFFGAAATALHRVMHLVTVPAPDPAQGIAPFSGGVAEWLKAHAWKVCIR